MDKNTFNGWANEKTYVVGTCLLNNRLLYKQARFYVERTKNPTWQGFLKMRNCYGEIGNVYDKDSVLDSSELTRLLKEIKNT